MKGLMRKIISLSFLSTALLASFGTQAAETTELKVIGTIKPAACTPSFSGGASVDYGTIFASSLKADTYTTLPAKQVNLTMTCDAPTLVALKLSDNRAGSRVTDILAALTAPPTSSPNNYNFGLGSVDGMNVGGFALSIDDTTTVDSAATTNIYSTDDGKSWHTSVKYLQHGAHIFSFGAATGPVAMKVLAAKINIETIINKPENLPLKKDIPLDGSATVEVVYL